MQNSECVIQDLVTENADLQSRVQAKDRELAQKVSLSYCHKCNIVPCFTGETATGQGQGASSGPAATEREGEILAV